MGGTGEHYYLKDFFFYNEYLGFRQPANRLLRESVRKEIFGLKSKPSVAWGENECGGACEQSFDAADSRYQILVSCSEW